MFRTRLHLLGIALLVSAIALTTRLGAAVTLERDLESGQHASHTEASTSRLVEQVREATEAFRYFNESPNRFGLPAFYELHVWAWRDNPKGTFADWNTRVSCDGQ